MICYAIVDSTQSHRDWPTLVDGYYCATTLESAESVIPPGSDILIQLGDDDLRRVLKMAHRRRWVLTLLPHPKATQARRGLFTQTLFSKKVDFENSRTVPTDIVFCNDEPVLNKVVVGRAFSFQPGGHSKNLMQRLKTVWGQLRRLGDYQPIRLKFKTPANETETETAAVGMVATAHVLNSSLSKRLLPEKLINDTMFYSWFVAPKSLLEMLKYFVLESLSKAVPQPGFIGVLRSTSLSVESTGAMPVRVDGRDVEASQLELQCAAEYVTCRVVNDSEAIDCTARAKEIRRLQNLPIAKESVHALTTERLPWITHAATEEFRELYQQLRENAQASTGFVMFMVLSTVLASFGLYANSAPVIIGAMILAPLMAPIVSLAMAFARQDDSLLRQSGVTLMIGFLIAVGCATLLSVFLPLQIETDEISARLRPTLLDLGIALVSGVAGAYANARSEAAKSLAGVAIAVALVPPLSVVGIGLGWLDLRVAGGALLLFVTNLAGIVFAASITFLLLGFAPLARARKGVVTAFLAVLFISLPLAFSFYQLTKEARIVAVIETVESEEFEIRQVNVLGAGPVVRLQMSVVSDGDVDREQIDQLKSDIQTTLNKDVVLEINWITRY